MGIATRKIQINLRKTESTVEDFMLSAANARNQIDGDQNAMNKYGQNLLTKFRDQVEEQNKKEWKNYEDSTRYLASISTNKCLKSEQEVDQVLKLGIGKARDILKENFKYLEVGAGWNKKFAPDSDEFSNDRTIQRFKNRKSMKAKSKGAPDKIL